MISSLAIRVPLNEDEAFDQFDEDSPVGLSRKMSRRGASLRLKCIGKQESDENPLMTRPSTIPSAAAPPSSLNLTATDPLTNKQPLDGTGL